MHRSTPAASAFRPEVQGLRAVAVLLVVIFHLWPLRLSGGYVGVDVFFVISGYLITAHILQEVRSAGRLSVPGFWARRIRRLLPASLLVLFLTAVATRLLLPATLWDDAARHISASALYVENWALAVDAVDYMAQDNVPTPVQHYWSLSVEEQFYLVWPLLVAVLVWLADRRLAAMDRDRRIRVVAGAGLGTLAVASALWSVWSTPRGQAFAYVSTATRAWEFAAGALTAIVGRPLPRRWRVPLAWLGLAAMVYAGFTYTEASPFPGWMAALPVLGTVTVLACGEQRGRHTAVAWLSVRPMVLIGDISYSVYLVHWPLIIIVPYVTGHLLTWPEKLGILAATLVGAWLSKTYVEDPLRRSRWLGARARRAFVAALVGMAVVVGGSTALARQATQDPRAAAATIEEATATVAPCVGPRALDPRATCTPVTGSQTPLVPAAVVVKENTDGQLRGCQQSLDVDALLTCDIGQTSAPTRTVALVGDSHAAHWIPMMDALAKDQHWRVIVMTKSSCPLTTARRGLPSEATDARQRSCETWNAAALAALRQNRTITKVFVSAFSSAYTWSSRPGHPLAAPAVDGYREAWTSLEAAGKQVVVLADVPRTNGQVIPTCLSLHSATPLRCALRREAATPEDATVSAARQAPVPAVTVVDLTAQFCDVQWCYPQVGGVIVYRDKTHLSRDYATLLAPYVAQALGLKWTAAP